MIEPLGEFTEDAFLGGTLRLRQPKSGHRAGHDAMLLAAATPARPGDRVVDFGAGVGAAGLAVAKRVAGIKLVLVEIDERLAELARGNAVSNAIAAETVVLDVTAAAGAFAASGPVVRQRRRRPDESAVQRFRASPRLAGQGPRDRPYGHSGDARKLDSRQPAHPEIRRSPRHDLARGRNCRGAGGARSRFWQPRHLARSRRCDVTGNSRAGSRGERRKGARRACCQRCCSTMSRRSPIKRCKIFWPGRGHCRWRYPEGYPGQQPRGYCGSVFELCFGAK